MEPSTQTAPSRKAPQSEQAEGQKSPTAPRGDAEPPHKGRKRPPLWLLIVGAIAIVAGLIFGIKFLVYTFGHEGTDDAKVDADTISVSSKISERVARVLTDTNQPVTRGQVIMLLDDRDERSKLAAALSNRQAQLAQAEAARTNVALTSATQQAESLQSSGGIASAQAAILNAAASASSAQSQVQAAAAAIAQARAQLRAEQSNVPSAAAALAKADAQLRRSKALAATGDVAQQTLDTDRAAQAQAAAQYQSALQNVRVGQTSVAQAEAKYTAAIASAEAARAAIGTQRGQLTTAMGKLSESSLPFRVSAQRAQYNAAQAQVRALDAQARTARDQLSYTVIRSPIDGIIAQKNVEIGSTVAPGQALMNIAPRTGTYITANFKETQLGKICVGQDVDITVDAYNKTPFHGKVQTIAPASQGSFSLVPAQNSTGNFVKVTQRLPIRITVVDPPADKPLRVGMSVETSVDIHSQCR